MTIKNKAAVLSAALELFSLMSLLLVVPENNTNCKIQQNIVYSKSNTRFSLFVFQFSQNASAPPTCIHVKDGVCFEM